EAHRLARVGRQRGAEAPDGTVRRARGEAVVVLLVRAEPRDASFQRVALGARRRYAPARDDAAELAVAGDLELGADAPVDLVQARPQRDRPRRRLPGHDALREPPPAGERRRPGLPERLRGEDGGRGGGAGGGDELTAG